MPSGGKELHKVMELPMDVAAHCDRAVDWLHVRLLDEYLLYLDDQRNTPRLHTRYTDTLTNTYTVQSSLSASSKSN